MTGRFMRRAPSAGQSSEDVVTSFIQSTVWAKALTEQERRHLLPCLRYATYEKGQQIVRRGSPAEYWMGVVEGFAVQSLTSADGQEAMLAGVGPGGWFGEGTLLKREPWGYCGIALRTTRLVLMPASEFEALRQSNLAFNHHLQTLLNDRLATIVEIALSSRIGNRVDRVAHALVRVMATAVSGERFLPVTQRELGMLAGLSRQRVNEALRTLSGRGAVRCGRHGVEVLDPAALRLH